MAYRGWHQVNNQSGLLTEKGEEIEYGIAKGTLVIGNEGKPAMSFMSGIERMPVCIFESSQFEGLYVGGILYCT